MSRESALMQSLDLALPHPHRYSVHSEPYVIPATHSLQLKSVYDNRTIPNGHPEHEGVMGLLWMAVVKDTGRETCEDIVCDFDHFQVSCDNTPTLYPYPCDGLRSSSGLVVDCRYSMLDSRIISFRKLREGGTNLVYFTCKIISGLSESAQLRIQQRP